MLQCAIAFYGDRYYITPIKSTVLAPTHGQYILTQTRCILYERWRTVPTWSNASQGSRCSPLPVLVRLVAIIHEHLLVCCSPSEVSLNVVRIQVHRSLSVLLSAAKVSPSAKTRGVSNGRTGISGRQSSVFIYVFLQVRTWGAGGEERTISPPVMKDRATG